MFYGFNFFFCAILFLIIETSDCRDDEDTELINTSFAYEIKHLHDNLSCLIDGKNVQTIIVPPFKLPTCLKNFYESAHMRACGKPNFIKFRYCARALYYQGKSYKDVIYNKEWWNATRSILVLIDGCLSCYPWNDRATNVTIEFLNTNTKTRSDRFADFKIGRIFKIQEPYKQIQPKLVITHTCNQYNMRQTKYVTLPALYPHRMENGVFEAKAAFIPLRQGADLVVEEDLLPEPTKKKKDNKNN